MIIKLVVKTLYGVDYSYPACTISKLFLELTGNKTLLERDLIIIKQLGYNVEYMPYIPGVKYV